MPGMTLPCLNEDQCSEFSGCANDLKVASLRQMDEAARREFWASLALRHCRKIGVRTRTRLLRYFGSAYIAVQHLKDWRAASVNRDCEIEFTREAWRIPAKKEWDEAARSSASIILWSSSGYPARLREIIDPPTFLYCQGDMSLLQSPAIAIVGSRAASQYSLKTACYLARSLSSKGLCVVSGMASGIDRFAHKGALEEVGRSIGVLGTGLNISYPSSNMDIYGEMGKYGLLLSEFAPNLQPAGINFPIRNRLISGLSLGVLVVEAAQKSGSLITAKYALEQNREVFAVPGQAMNSRSMGCQNLVRQGAHPVFCADDILRELADLLKSQGYARPAINGIPSFTDLSSESELPCNALNPDESRDAQFVGKEIAEKSCSDELGEEILRHLASGPKLVEELSDLLQADINEVNSRLLLLEMLGRIQRIPGARFQLL